MAAEIQRQILPRASAHRGPRDRGRNVPPAVEAILSFFPWTRGRLFFLFSSRTSGKGIPAALLVSTVHAAVHLQIDEAETIADLMGRIDRHLQKYAATRKFLTCFFGVIEPGSGLLRYVSAGHNPALLRRAAGGAVEQVKATGVPLGLFRTRMEVRDRRNREGRPALRFRTVSGACTRRRGVGMTASRGCSRIRPPST